MDSLQALQKYDRPARARALLVSVPPCLLHVYIVITDKLKVARTTGTYSGVVDRISRQLSNCETLRAEIKPGEQSICIT